MVTFLLVVALCLAAAMSVGRWLDKPYRHRRIGRQKLEALVRTLLYQGYHHGRLFLDRKGSPIFLQVVKYVDRPRVGLRLDFPDAPWSRDLYPLVRSFAHTEGLPTFEQTTGELVVRRFLMIDLGNDSRRISEVLWRVANDVLSFDLEKEGIGYLENIAVDPEAQIGFERAI